jgi:hypothetical protein
MFLSSNFKKRIIPQSSDTKKVKNSSGQHKKNLQKNFPALINAANMFSMDHKINAYYSAWKLQNHDKSII